MVADSSLRRASARMHRILPSALIASVTVLSAGCSMMAPQYTPSLSNVQSLRDGGNAGARVGGFASAPNPGNENPISLRGNSMVSPYNGNYGDYLAEALRQELGLAKRLAASADTEISGTVLKNTVDASGINTGTVDIEVRFIVRRGPDVRFDRVKSMHHEFPSSFAGAVAIPRATQEYPVSVQKLLAALYSDKDFLESLKK